MDKIANLPLDIGEQIAPTISAFHPLLEKNRELITSVPKKAFQYGETERHCLDVYYPPVSNTLNAKSPLLFFIYGGGFTTGDRNRAPPYDLIYSCLGAFFALRGFITIIPDYRLAPATKFPGAAQDVLSAITWSLANPSKLVSTTGSPEPDLNSLFISGHSAGAIHTATLTFHRELIPVGSELRNRIKGVVMIAGPYHYLPSSAWREMAEAHWGSEENATENSPLSLLLSWFSNNTTSIPKPPKMLVVQAENEAKWIYDLGLEYQKALEWHAGESVEYVEGKGHNHISLFWALLSGEGQEWGVRAADWMWEVLCGGGGGGAGGPGAGAEILKNIKETDVHECPKCQQRKTRSFKIEIGSRTTPSKTFVSCVGCGNRWTL